MLDSPSLSNGTKFSGFGRGDFILDGKDLHFTIYFTGVRRATTFEIKDDKGVLLLRKDVRATYGKYKKYCGNWDDMPGRYILYLRKGLLRATLSSSYHDTEGITGTIATHRALRDETFSALLFTEDGGPGRGIAHLSYNIKGNSISYVVQHLNLSDRKDDFTTFVIRFEIGGRVLHQRTLRVASKEKEFSEIWTSLSKAESRQLGRGKIQMKISTPGGSTIRGHITPKILCGGFEAMLTPSGVQNHTCLGRAKRKSATILLRLTRDGDFSYEMSLNRVHPTVEYISVESPSPNGKKKNVLYSEAPAPKGYTSSKVKKNKKMTAKTIQMLFQNRIFVYIGTKKCPRLLGGEARHILRSREMSPIPKRVILSGSSTFPPIDSKATGIADLDLEESCELFFGVLIEGINPWGKVFTPKFVKAHKKSNGRKESKAPWKKTILQLPDFKGETIKGRVKGLSRDLIKELTGKRVYLVVATESNEGGLIAGRVKINNKCDISTVVNKTTNVVRMGVYDNYYYDMLNDEEDPNPNLPSTENTCRVNDVVYSPGDSWRGEDQCVMCTCERGLPVCHKPLCPSLNCKHPQLLDGECCPQCIDEFFSVGNSSISTKKSCYFDGDQRWHQFGTRWHPYVPPFGFVACAICECGGDEGAVKCKKTECPPLKCDESLATRKSQSDCCKTCPETQDTEPFEEESPQDDESPDVNSCYYRGHHFKEGDQWHPRLLPYGREKCVTCTCANRVVQCHREECPKLKCQKKIRPQGECCPTCDDTRPKRMKKRRKKTRQN